MVQDACSVKITPELLKLYTSEWQEKQRVEKEREQELDTLRSTNVSLALKVRSLEERTEKSDTEHVQMASELWGSPTKMQFAEVCWPLFTFLGVWLTVLLTDPFRTREPETEVARLEESDWSMIIFRLCLLRPRPWSMRICTPSSCTNRGEKGGGCTPPGVSYEQMWVV